VFKYEQKAMNRRKKGIQILKARIKRSNAKLNPQSKPKYISKVDRVESAAEDTDDPTFVAEQ
jgi:hypothetical protein